MKNKFRKSWINKDTLNLFDTITKIQSSENMQKFLRDLMTETEIIEFGKRWKAAKMLHKGDTYTEIEKKTGLSSTTIARVQKWLTEGMGGYRKAIENESKNE